MTGDLERQRRALIAELELGNAEPERSLTDLVELAALVCRAPMAAFTVLDGEQQWFKARHGLQGESGPRVATFCNLTVERGRLVEVEDARADPAFAQHPFVVGGPQLRFYAGVPVGLEGTPAVGTLCVLDRSPRQLVPAERDALEALGRQLTLQLELRQRTLRERTARLSAEAQVVRSERLATVGRLAASLAHEVGTPLAVVTGRARILANALPFETESRKSATIIVEQSERIAHFVRQLLDFARRREPKKARYELAVIARQAVALLQPMAATRAVQLSWKDFGRPLVVEVDASQLGQVVTNLLVNALHATAPGGRVEVSASERGGRVALSVADTGHGIAPSHLERIFEPFFTTKDTGDGTGLGLSVSADIVRDHGGTLLVESEVGRGTVFTLELPR